jgi:cytochrome c553
MTAHSRRHVRLGIGCLLAAVPCALAAATPPCEACHGAHGEGMAAAHIPRIAGQSADYLQKQLDDYAQGARESPVMSNFARQLSAPQRAQLAARYAAMSAPFIAPTTPSNDVQLARGHQLAYQGDELKRVASCNSCHGPDGMGVAHAAPYLAGQSPEYLAGELEAFHQGARKNDSGQLMRSVARNLDEADVAAVSAYFASLVLSSH